MNFEDLELGYDIPARPGMSLGEIATPALMVDLDAFERNLAWMRDLVLLTGLSLRGHAKTHKLVDIARLQVELGGARGICCQKVSEAEVFVRGGIEDILVSNQVWGAARAERLARLAERARITVCVDDVSSVETLSVAAMARGTTLGVLVEIDCGSHRCGVAPGAAAVKLAQAVARPPGLSPLPSSRPNALTALQSSGPSRTPSNPPPPPEYIATET